MARKEEVEQSPFEQAMALVEEAAFDKDTTLKVVEYGVEEEVIYLLLAGWSMRAISDRLQRQYEVVISFSSIARFARAIVTPVKGLDKKLKERLERIEARISVLEKMEKLIKQGEALCDSMHDVESKLGLPIAIGIDLRKEQREMLKAYYDIEERELGLERKTLVQMNQFNMGNKLPIDPELMDDERLDEYLARLPALDAVKNSGTTVGPKSGKSTEGKEEA